MVVGLGDGAGVSAGAGAAVDSTMGSTAGFTIALGMDLTVEREICSVIVGLAVASGDDEGNSGEGQLWSLVFPKKASTLVVSTSLQVERSESETGVCLTFARVGGAFISSGSVVRKS
jgi:hypothetical protein